MLLAGALAACSGGSGAPVPTTPPTPTVDPTPSTSAAEALSAMAAIGARASYHATYLAQQRHPATRATWLVWRTPSSLRVDVVTKHAKTTLIVTPNASYSCRAAKHRTCLLVAKGGKPIPAPLRLLAEKLFSGDIKTLSTDSASYDVQSTEEGCYAISPMSNAPKPRAERADYCFNTAGVLTSVTFPSGNVVRLRSLTMKTPPHSAFVPYASPTPLSR
jgi:hypothetical protein